jgi:alpha-L-arabinofuranosidase
MTRLLVLPLLLLITSFMPFQERNRPNQLVVVTNNPGPVISKDIYGHFSEHLGRCIYEGIWVGNNSTIPNTEGIRNDVLKALKDIKVPNLRWPGGCFADTYHWRDGIGPQEQRASIVNIHWGGVTEDNSFGTHEFMRLTELIDCDAYINGNLGSGTVQEMAEWVEYLTSSSDSPVTRLRKQNGREEPWKVPYFAVGNENWGCGGNMTAQFYSDLLRQYSTYLLSHPGNRLYKVACGPYGADYSWTETLMKEASTRNSFQGLSIHYYTVVDGWGYKGSATAFDEREWFETFRLNYDIDRIIKGHKAVMDRYDPSRSKGLIVDEWGNWFNVEPGTNTGFLYQQNSLRDAITAAIHLNIFNSHADRLKVANLAQVVNVLQAVILTEGEKMLLTPTYHVFRMFSVHQEARLLPIDLNVEDYTYGDKGIPSVSVSASVDKEGKVNITLANLNPNKEIDLSCILAGGDYKPVAGEVLTAREMTSHNTFDNPSVVAPVPFRSWDIKNNKLMVKLPPKSVVLLQLSGK